MRVHPSLSISPALALGLEPRTAHLLSLLLTTGYVGSLYIAQHLPGLSRSSSSDSSNHSPQTVPGGSSGLAEGLKSTPTTAAAPAAATGPSEKDIRDAEGYELVDPDLGVSVPTLPKPEHSSTTPAAVPATSEAAGEPGPPVGSRDHPATIRRRITAVGLTTAASLLGVGWIVARIGNYGPLEAIRPSFRLLGLPLPPSPLTSFRFPHPCIVFPYLAAPTLFLGPLYASWLDGSLPFQGPSSSPHGGLWGRVKAWFGSWDLKTFRNLVVGPVTEELTFRSALIALALLARLSPSYIIFGSPLWFGVAHMHHAWEVYVQRGRNAEAAKMAVGQSLFQLSYTTLFGWFAAFLFLRTGSVLPPLASHVFCNYMGIYMPGDAVARHPSHRLAIWAAYVAGIAGFVGLIRGI